MLRIKIKRIKLRRRRSCTVHIWYSCLRRANLWTSLQNQLFM